MSLEHREISSAFLLAAFSAASPFVCPALPCPAVKRECKLWHDQARTATFHPGYGNVLRAMEDII